MNWRFIKFVDHRTEGNSLFFFNKISIFRYRYNSIPKVTTKDFINQVGLVKLFFDEKVWLKLRVYNGR